ncbi:alpha/beta hydrolase [Lacisediminihabitans profunda]|uniref:Alpha/beta hydrolase n=1 Tax=Lacisediminihabitans profunda TaxID=2594790 RepID=A0A5C8USV6_9MICO|nr:alpha/beta hydrolase [Lacisediminihabitans profunda]TXN30600.1 alpha/beta hydrolase [Lacisediminihabitans profunda]
MNADQEPSTFVAALRALEAGTFPVDQRPDVDTASLRARYSDLAEVRLKDVVVPASNGDVAGRLYLPAGDSKGAVVWAHGGSFIGGDIEMPEGNWVALALAARGYSVLSVEYTKALLGVHFPVPSIDLLDSWNWADDHLGFDESPVHLGGASAGGNLAAGVGVRLRDGAGRVPSSLVLAYPVLHDVIPAASAEIRAAVDSLGPEARFPPETVREMNLNYAGSEAALGDPYAFPAHANLAGMPPIFIINSQSDDLRSSGEGFAQQALEAGVDVRVECEPGTVHGHLDRPHSAGGQRSIARIGEWLDGFTVGA